MQVISLWDEFLQSSGLDCTISHTRSSPDQDPGTFPTRLKAVKLYTAWLTTHFPLPPCTHTHTRHFTALTLSTCDILDSILYVLGFLNGHNP